MEQANVCGFEGNSDLYGLGIRLGVYTQWHASYFVSLWRVFPESRGGGLNFPPLGLHSRLDVIRTGLVEDYVIFVLALVVAMMTSKARAKQTHAVDILILAYIVFGGMMVLMGYRFPVKFPSRLELSIPPATADCCRSKLYRRSALLQLVLVARRT
jgi:hypothetical protein